MTPEAKLTQPARVAAVRAKRSADVPLTEGEHALFLDAEAFELRAELAEVPPDVASAREILAEAQDGAPSVRNRG